MLKFETVGEVPTLFSDLQESPRMKLGNFFIPDLSTTELIAAIDNRIIQHDKALLFFANTNFIVKCQHLKETILSSPSFVVNDGIGMELANKFVNKYGFKQNLNGTDFVPKLLEIVQNKKIILLGSKHEDIAPTAKKITEMYGHEIVAQIDGYNDLKNPNLLDDINALKADIILVGLGNPLQEEWILNHYKKLNIPLHIGVGALFKFMSGNQKRAPAWMRKYRLEWLHRLFTEPARLFMRYTFDIVKFFSICLRNK